MTLGLALTLTGFAAASAYGAPAKPPYVPKVSGQDAKLPAGLAATPQAKSASKHALPSSPDSTDRSGSATATAPPAPSTPRSTDPALKTVDLGALPQSQTALNSLKTEAQAAGSVRVIVTLNTKFTPLNALTSSSAASQKSTVSGLSDDVVSLAAAHGGKVTHTFGGNIPAVSMTATPATLDALAASPAVARVTADGVNKPTDATTTPLIGAADAHDRGYHGGGGTVVVIMDTGTQYDHPALGGRVHYAACFSANSDCPLGGTAEYGGNSGMPCQFGTSECDHGTHVAGIAAGQATASYPEGGIADQANIFAIRVFHMVNVAATCSPRPAPCARRSTPT